MTDLGATDTGARLAWQELDVNLQRFIARRLPSPADADDVRQEVLLRVREGLHGLRDEQRLGAWVFRIARHAIVDHRRQAARAMPHADPDATAGVEAGEGDDEDAETALAACVAPFVARLPSPYREALTLTELEGLTQRQAASMLEISLPAMKSRVLRGKARLRAMFEACCEIALDARGHVRECAVRPAGCDPRTKCGGR